MLALSFSAEFAAASDLIFETTAQFEASQKIRGEGFAAFRSGEHATALTKMEAALKERPGNTLLLGYVAYLAAETGNLARAEEAALAFAATGQTPGGAIQDKLAEKLSPGSWAAIKFQFDKNAEPLGNADVIARLTTDIHLVEGIAVAPDGRLFISSVVSGGIYRVKGDNAVPLALAKDHAMGSFFGIAYDTASQRLYATFARVDQTPGLAAGEGTTGVAVFDTISGALLDKWVLDGPTDKHQIADLLITGDHTIFVSDATNKAVYNIAADKLVKAFDLPDAISPQGLAELNGKLYLADYGRGLWLLDRQTSTAAIIGRTEGISLIGIDGLSAHDDQLIAIQNGSNPHKVLSIKLNADGASVAAVNTLAQALPTFDEPTLGVATDAGYYFVAGSQWPKFGPGGHLKEGTYLQPTVLMKITMP